MVIAFRFEANFPIKIDLKIRYVLGLIPATTDSEYDKPWKNNLFQITAGYRILGK
jgi:hypothetical protein